MFCNDGNGAWIIRFTIDLHRKQDGNKNGYIGFLAIQQNSRLVPQICSPEND
jgi:hypothetical protein